MYVLAVATAVCALYKKAIEVYMGLVEKALLHHLASSVTRIYNILSPFTFSLYKGSGEVQLSQSIRILGDILLRTKEHLFVWKSKKLLKFVAFLNPTWVVQLLKEE